MDFFEDTMTTLVPDLESHIFNVEVPCLSEEEKQTLLKDVQNEEIVDALKHMKPFKAPSPNGYQAFIFQHFWHLVGDQVCVAVKYFFSNGTFSLQLYHSFITLIPKIMNPSLPEHFRPINLTNVVYKIISKIIVNRLRSIIQRIVGPFQTAFLPKRNIHDNVLLAYEFYHKIRGHGNRKSKFLL
ncbi:hypothetical protein IFM89_010701 [Coptis chinensis]|uniref:Reverse transcriptase domain-containing protein n=1 Tax=Coptis chinensis TaxID=261450 RepID=A0A835MDS3_9MAGN|nr:hypothetical protein IFM89_010701 [Coptis chinensis]